MTTPRPRTDGWCIAFVIAALGNLANGAWMLADPVGWFHTIPGVIDSGPLNEHFVRDLGATFSLVGVGFLWAAFRPAERVAVLTVVSVFYVGHALVHVWDTLRGLLPPSHWTGDIVPIYAPALLLLAVLAVLVRREATS